MAQSRLTQKDAEIQDIRVHVAEQQQEISDVVATVAGYHIIQLIETRPPDTAPFTDVKEGIQKLFFMQNGRKRLEQYVEKLRKQAKVEVLY